MKPRNVKQKIIVPFAFSCLSIFINHLASIRVCFPGACCSHAHTPHVHTPGWLSMPVVAVVALGGGTGGAGGRRGRMGRGHGLTGSARLLIYSSRFSKPRQTSQRAAHTDTRRHNKRGRGLPRVSPLVKSLAFPFYCAPFICSAFLEDFVALLSPPPSPTQCEKWTQPTVILRTPLEKWLLGVSF